ncbi:MAG: diaminopimelate decarboxylase [Oscillospiraceae bacterium]|nr:diaminopimelate decarboxylase [Oscillospiraceae bacterium]
MLSDNISRRPDGVLTFAGHSVPALAEEYGTPLYLMDEERIRHNCRLYTRTFRECFGEQALPLYAGKAASFQRMYRIVREEGLGIDAVSAGEIHTALRAGFPPEKIFFHGDGKTDADIRYAIEHRIGYFIVDNPDELSALAEEARHRNHVQKVLLRVTPGIDPHTYKAVNTGTVDVKFGVPMETGQAFAFVEHALSLPSLSVCGLHCHVGSEVFDETVFEDTIDVMTAFMAELHQKLGFVTDMLNVGGGYGVRYLDSDKQIDIPGRIRHVAAHLKERTAFYGLKLPCFLMEPGRSIVADAGMTVYTVSSVKRIPGYKYYVVTDGGMTDNPRYCLYHAPYTVLCADRESRFLAVYDLAGRCCESGDIIQPSVSLPQDIARGDHVAVCTTGAYNYSMASNYNRLPRPPVVMLTPEGSSLAVRRETPEDLCALDL